MAIVLGIENFLIQEHDGTRLKGLALDFTSYLRVYAEPPLIHLSTGPGNTFAGAVSQLAVVRVAFKGETGNASE